MFVKNYMLDVISNSRRIFLLFFVQMLCIFREGQYSGLGLYFFVYCFLIVERYMNGENDIEDFFLLCIFIYIFVFIIFKSYIFMFSFDRLEM